MRHTNVGLIDAVDGVATPGVTIVTPLFGTGVYFIGLDGEVLHQWATDLPPATYARLLPKGIFGRVKLPKAQGQVGIKEAWSGKSIGMEIFFGNTKTIANIMIFDG